MRGLSRWFLVLGVMAMIACPAMAQRGGFRGGMMGGGGAMMLLMNEGVQKELKLTDEQKEKTTELVQSVREKHQEDFAGLQDLSQEERVAKMTKVMGAIDKEIYTALASAWKPEQVKRLKQISLQTRGINALASEEVQKDLKITDAQKDKLKTLTTDQQKERQAAMQEARDNQDFAGFAKKSSEISKEFMGKALALLDDKQKASWKEMTGDPFELVMGQGGFGGGKGGKGKRKKADN